MAPQHHGPFATVVDTRRPDVQHKAVFAFGCRLPASALRAGVGLWRTGAILQRVTYSGPFGRVERRHETILTRRRGAIRNAFEDFDAVGVYSTNLAKRCFGSSELGI